MRIQFTPQRREDSLVLVRAGDVLTVNGEVFSFEPIKDGDVLPVEAIDSPWFAGPVTRVQGQLQIVLVLPFPANFSPAQSHPDDLVLTSDGPVALPQPLPAPEIEQEPAA